MIILWAVVFFIFGVFSLAGGPIVFMFYVMSWVAVLLARNTLEHNHRKKLLDSYDPKTRALIEESKIALEMTEEQATLAWGKPARTSITADYGGVKKIFQYDGGSWIGFHNGKVLCWGHEPTTSSTGWFVGIGF